MKVFVSNVPVRTFAEAWVEIPDGTSAVDRHQAIVSALRDGRFETTSACDPDDALLDKWEFSTPMEES
jgi:hypothetical protein